MHKYLIKSAFLQVIPLSNVVHAMMMTVFLKAGYIVCMYNVNCLHTCDLYGSCFFCLGKS